MPMLKRYTNGLGIAFVSAIMAVTPLIPAAVSAPAPVWVWDEQGRVSDSSGQFVRVEEEAKQPPPFMFPILLSSGGESGGG